MNLGKLFPWKLPFLAIFGDAQGYGSEALQIASHWLKMAMGMLYDLACRSTKSLMRQLNVWVRGVWVWPLQWQGCIPLTSFIAAITPVQLGNGYGGYGSKLRFPGEYHKISQEPAAMDVYPQHIPKNPKKSIGKSGDSNGFHHCLTHPIGNHSALLLHPAPHRAAFLWWSWTTAESPTLRTLVWRTGTDHWCNVVEWRSTHPTNSLTKVVFWGSSLTETRADRSNSSKPVVEPS